MSVFWNDILGIGSNGTIYKFIIIFVLLYQMKMKISIYKFYKRRIYKHLNDIRSNNRIRLLRQNLLVFFQYFIRNTKNIFSLMQALPNRISFVWVLQASLVGMRCDSKHNFTPPTILLGLLLCPCTWGIFFGGIQHSPIDGISLVSCNFGVLTGEDEPKFLHTEVKWYQKGKWNFTNEGRTQSGENLGNKLFFFFWVLIESE